MLSKRLCISLIAYQLLFRMVATHLKVYVSLLPITIFFVFLNVCVFLYFFHIINIRLIFFIYSLVFFSVIVPLIQVIDVLICLLRECTLHVMFAFMEIVFPQAYFEQTSPSSSPFVTFSLPSLTCFLSSMFFHSPTTTLALRSFPSPTAFTSPLSTVPAMTQSPTTPLPPLSTSPTTFPDQTVPPPSQLLPMSNSSDGPFSSCSTFIDYYLGMVFTSPGIAPSQFKSPLLQFS